MTPAAWRTLRDWSLAFVLAGVAGFAAALFSSALIGFVVAIGVGVLMMVIYYLFAPEELAVPPLRVRRSGFRPGQKLKVDFGVLGDVDARFVGLAGPPGRPNIRVRLAKGDIISVPPEAVAPVTRLRGAGRRFWQRLKRK